MTEDSFGNERVRLSKILTGVVPNVEGSQGYED